MAFLFFVLYLCSSVKQSCCQTTASLGPPISKIFAKSSGKIRLDCAVEESSLSKWLINDTRVTFGTDFIANIPKTKMRLLSNYSLIIAQVNTSDEGLYRCMHKDELVSMYQLEVEVPPVKTMLIVDGKVDPTELWMRMNDFVNITCCARGAKPAVYIQWVTNDIIHTPQTVVLLNEKDGTTFDSVSSLRFTMTQNAYISCKFIQGTSYRQEKKVVIWKAVTPSMSMVWQDMVITEPFFAVAGEEYELSCLLHSANSVNITWRINNTIMRSHNFVQDVGEMHNATKSILYLKPECCNEINVSCIASQRQSLEDLQSTIVVYTIEKPTIYILDAKGNIVTQLLAVYGSEYNLTCTAVGGKPHNITWFIMDVPSWRAVTYNTTNQSRVNVAFSKYTYMPDGQRFHQDNFFHISCSTFDDMALREIRYTINVTNIGGFESVTSKLTG
ncbi:hypothetical protein HOLleu_03916 [Holothuria leucospilota]|uniref:Ig-like domain-containing protein n=1 Tax=Holothuria leucospilota TaxID=206669 RepID=A0A9Q1CTZ2_HOLLE|nr:hypothetical protein HOLleu_03916 [Holothuria leucospilota]